jgi:hypothetical protein
LVKGEVELKRRGGELVFVKAEEIVAKVHEMVSAPQA